MSQAARVAAFVGLLALTGCDRPSELMIAVDTDLHQDVDVDSIQIEVLRGEELRFLHAFGSLGTLNPQARLPLTLGLVAEEEPGAEVRIRVSARKNEQPRILREAVTTIPAERVALLHLPLRFLCLDSAERSAGDQVVNAFCGEGETCVAGGCASSAVDSSTLPDYTPEAVFGGGSGAGDGDCFDVAACFAAATEVTVDADCAFALPSDGPINVALRTVGAGIPVDAGNLVALDADSADGFTVSAGRVVLPMPACMQRMAGKVDAVVTAAVNEGCPRQKTLGLPTCGSWSATGAE